ncbi:aldo/keto reductase [Sphingobacterium multivorum]|uniref:aldo/keto reductase n=1 Tax=Sphingobacterium multivorum TaxID=28454 RepID=UPI00345E6983
MKKTKLGSQGLEVPVLGLGCMNLAGSDTQFIYGKADQKESIALIQRSLELGVNFLDSADIYGPHLSERLIAKAVTGKRDQVIIATKFGFEINDQEQMTGKRNGTKAYARLALERSLKNLQTDYIDLYYLHRLDPDTPIEETIEAMAEMVKEGKVRYIGLSEVTKETIRRAHEIHPITALQTEYSLFERTLDEDGTTGVLRELGIGLVPYSPLGRGFITGELKSPEDFPQEDPRRNYPRFQGENFIKNLELVDQLAAMAAEKNATTAQLALAWSIAKGHVPIPGTRKIKYLEQNIGAEAIELNAAEIDRLESILPLGITQSGKRQTM